MTLRQRIEEAARRAGYTTQTALATALGIKQPSLYALLAGHATMTKQLQKIAELTGVSATWLRTGDPSEAPPWADPVAVARDALARLSDVDRLRLQAELALAQGDVDHEPASAAAELGHWRMFMGAARTELNDLEALAAEQLRRVQDLRRRMDTAESVAATAPETRAAAPRQRYQIGQGKARVTAQPGPQDQ